MPEAKQPQIRFIKLGEGGRWEASCIAEGTVRLGYHSPHHQASLSGQWDVVRTFWLEQRKGNEGATTSSVNQIKDFYELTEDDIWITFHRKRMYWCRAGREVHELEDGSRIRRTIGNWSSMDGNGRPLSIENIDGRVTKVQGYRGTICTVQMPDYVLRKINGDVIQEVMEAEQALAALKTKVSSLIAGLWWNDFELLIDLIFARAGWQRFSVLGKTGKDIDIDAFAPATGRRAFIQIKSETSLAEAERYIAAYQEYVDFDEMFFVYHTCSADLQQLASREANVHIWGLDAIATLVISSGLADWLINKRR
jgi:hypothetical protein